MKVGTRELKNRLSQYLRRVREEGEPVYVTDRGVVVAELRRVKAPRRKRRTERDALLELAAAGDVTLGGGRLSDFRPARVGRGTPVSRLILEERR